MVLDKIPEHKGMGPIQTPENVPRLFDLIRPKDDMYRKAFYKALSDTLVAADTEQATRIAYPKGGGRRWRVVTLAGNLIETSGAMSGGGGTPQRGAMNSKLSVDIPPEKLKEYEKDTVQAEEQLYVAQKELAEIEAELDRLKKAGPELDMMYQKLTLEIETRKVRIAEATKRVEDLK